MRLKFNWGILRAITWGFLIDFDNEKKESLLIA